MNRTQPEIHELEIDLLQLIRLLWRKKWVIAVSGVLCGASLLLYACLLVPPQYEARATMYVDNSASPVGSTAVGISLSELSAAGTLLDIYVVILESRTTLETVIERAGLDCTYAELEEMVSAGAVDGTGILEVTAVCGDPAEAKLIVDTITGVLPERIAEIVGGSTVRPVDTAVLPTERSSPSCVKYAAVGLLLGFVLSCIVLIVRDVLDHTVRDARGLAEAYQAPVLAAVPDCCGTSPAAAEAYRLMRTNLFACTAGDADRRVIGITSTMHGEGKTTTALHLARALAEAGKKTLLLDADMRGAGIHTLLGLEQAPGLSNLLIGVEDGAELLRASGLHDNLTVMTAGDLPSNPAELLASPRMEQLLRVLKDSFSYLILDLPPVGATADALIAAGCADGMILVVRRNAVDRRRLDDTVRQLKLHNPNLIGFVFNCVPPADPRHSRTRERAMKQ